MSTGIAREQESGAMLRFWMYVRMGDPSECWPWLGSTRSEPPYGVGRFAGRKPAAHRIAWELMNHRDAGDLYVCHTCDNPLCCNPGHLFLGTELDNQRDCARKGRFPQRKLTEIEVREIRRIYGKGGNSQSVLAERFGVHRAQISRIIRRRKWAWLPEDSSKLRSAIEEAKK